MTDKDIRDFFKKKSDIESYKKIGKYNGKEVIKAITKTDPENPDMLIGLGLTYYYVTEDKIEFVFGNDNLEIRKTLDRE